jgi:3-oxoacyl-[acyl-carrier-protein] synthase II
VNKRVVITGLGVIAPNGIGKKAFWDALRKGTSGIKPVTLFETGTYKVKIAGEATDFDPTQYFFSKRELINLDRATALLLISTKEALQDALLTISDETTHDVGVSVGTTFGSLQSLSDFDKESVVKGPQLVNPSKFPNTVANLPASQISIFYKIKGFNATLSTGMCAGVDAIDYACKHIRMYGKKAVVTSSVEEMCEQTFLGLHSLGCLAGLNGSETVSCPFDRRRSGIVFGEGAGTLILEDYDEAKKRDAHIYGEVLGCASNFDPLRFNRYNSKGTGMGACMKQALKNTGLKPDDIDLIMANANSSKDADPAEARAIRDVFQKKADTLPVTSIKSMTGETYSAAGILAAIAAVAGLTEDFIPPTINCEERDQQISLNVVMNKAQERKLNTIMINAFGPNGANSTVIIGRIG